EYAADENLRIDLQEQPVCVVRKPRSGATEFPMGLKLALFDPIQPQIELDRVKGAGGNRDALAAQHRDNRQVGVGRGIHDDSLHVALLEILAPQVEKRGLQIEQMRKIEVANSSAA